MTPEFIHNAALAARDNNWLAILPELMLGCTALLLLVLEILLPKRHQALIPGIAIAAQLGIASALFVNFRTNVEFFTFNGLLCHSTLGQFFRLFFLLTSVLVCGLGIVALRRQSLPRIEFFHIVLVVTAALMLLVQSNHFVSLFVSLETVAIGFYVLVSYFRKSGASLEAGLKYLIFGALSSAILLFGIMLLYGASTTPGLPCASTASPLRFESLQLFLAANPGNVLASVGIVMVLAGVGFKIGAFPFQIWVPDVYQGAPTPVTAFLAVGSKAAGFGLLFVLAHTVFSPYQNLVVGVLATFAIGTILFGNFAALTQHNVKRLMGLSGVAHAGFLLLAVISYYRAPGDYGFFVFYLFSYLLAAMCVFGVMVHVAGPDDADQTLDHYAGLARRQPFLAGVLVIGLGSLAGIPPLAGFLAKLLVFINVYRAGLYSLLAIAIVGVVLSIYYYFGWIKAAFFGSVPSSEGASTTAPEPLTLGSVVMLSVLASATLVLGFYQGSFGNWLLGR